MTSHKVGTLIKPDIERQFGGEDGFPTGYIFNQNQTVCTIQIRFDQQIRTRDINFSINPDTNCIQIGIIEQIPIVVGQLFSSFSRKSVSFENGLFTLTLSKVQSDKWPLLISGPNEAGLIDPKSSFILALYQMTQNNMNEFYDLILKSISNHYAPASEYFHEFIHFHKSSYLKIPPQYCIQIFSQFDLSSLSEEELEIYCNSLDESKMFQEEGAVLSQIRNPSPQLLLRYALLCSPLSNGPLNDPEHAVIMLTTLSEMSNPQALWLLAQHYENGIGVHADKKKAHELKKLAQKLDSSLQDNKASKVSHFIAPTIITVIIITSIFIFKLRKSK